ncbi:hypothetical protein O181_095792 [Austropuccinia psidii MF-1]|uniref:Integrase catalytic domain-containing protein n=1 Tax=Austropuccinia psidii MF-1 TaxID=1389203 RepID=A0A9Q3J5H7_9BASI|nr:hypothetical protein [Austropuccinia psidii MF-1]
MDVLAEGTFQVATNEGNLKISSSLLVPSATSTLIAMGPFLNEGAVLRGYTGGADLFNKEGKLLLKTWLVNNILVIDTAKVNSTNTVSSENLLLLHKRLGHPGKEIASKMLPKYDFFPLPSDVLEVTHMEVCGPINLTTRGGNQYIFQIIDGHSCMRFTYPMKSKSDCYHHFYKFQKMAENQTGQKIKAVVSDNGGEFINKEFLRIFEENGIIHLPTALYTPQQDLVAERENRSLLERIRVLLLDYQALVACSMAAYLLNQTPVSSLSFQTPISKWVVTSPSTGIDCLHPFGCTAVIHLPKERKKSNVGPTAVLCMFLGNVEGHHNFCLYDPESRRILITHNCTFKEGEAFWPLYSSSLPLPSLSSLSLPSALSLPADLPVESMSGASELISDPQVEALLDKGEGTSPEAVIMCPPQPIEKPLPKGWTYKLVAETAPKDVTSVISMEHIVSGKRSRQPPNRFAGAVVGMVPCSFREAMASSKSNACLNAIAREFASLEQHQVVKEVRQGKNQWLLGTTWVFREKTNTEGNVTEEKVRLCVKGFHQIEDVDFHEKFAPTGWLATLRFLLGYCASNDYDIQQMDVKTAFLHDDLDKDIF